MLISQDGLGGLTVSMSEASTSGLLPDRLLPRRCAACLGTLCTAGAAGATVAPDWREDRK